MESYLLAAVPSESVDLSIDVYRRKYARHTSYVIPSHITIYPPFFNGFASEEILEENLRQAYAGAHQAVVTLKGINFFSGDNNVVFLEPDQPSSKFLASLLVRGLLWLKGNIKDVHQGYQLTPDKFHPHLTIAERIPNDQFPKVRSELERANLSFSFLVNSLTLFRQLPDSSVWSFSSSFNLSPAIS